MGSGTHSSAKVDSYHLGAYAGRELGAWRLSTGAAYSWHRADVKRDLQYGDVSGKQKAKVDAATTQVFGEAAYRLHLQPLALEPFANLAYVHLDTEGLTEKGDAAALKSSGDQRDAVLSTLGVRAIKTFNLSPAQSLDVVAISAGSTASATSIPSSICALPAVARRTRWRVQRWCVTRRWSACRPAWR